VVSPLGRSRHQYTLSSIKPLIADFFNCYSDQKGLSAIEEFHLPNMAFLKILTNRAVKCDYPG
jgi:hypothetical protein